MHKESKWMIPFSTSPFAANHDLSKVCPVLHQAFGKRSATVTNKKTQYLYQNCVENANGESLTLPEADSYDV